MVASGQTVDVLREGGSRHAELVAALVVSLRAFRIASHPIGRLRRAAPLPPMRHISRPGRRRRHPRIGRHGRRPTRRGRGGRSRRPRSPSPTQGDDGLGRPVPTPGAAARHLHDPLHPPPASARRPPERPCPTRPHDGASESDSRPAGSDRRAGRGRGARTADRPGLDGRRRDAAGQVLRPAAAEPRLPEHRDAAAGRERELLRRRPLDRRCQRLREPDLHRRRRRDRSLPRLAGDQPAARLHPVGRSQDGGIPSRVPQRDGRPDQRRYAVGRRGPVGQPLRLLGRAPVLGCGKDRSPGAGDPGLLQYDVGLSIGGPLAGAALRYFVAYNPLVETADIELPGQGYFPDKLVSHRFAGNLGGRSTPPTTWS